MLLSLPRLAGEGRSGTWIPEQREGAGFGRTHTPCTASTKVPAEGRERNVCVLPEARGAAFSD